MRGDLLAVLGRDLPQGVLGYGQHSSSAAGAVVKQVGAGLDLVRNRKKDQPGHQSHSIARCPVLARFLVVLFVESPDQFLKDRAHAVVIKAGVPDGAIAILDWAWTQVDLR